MQKVRQVYLNALIAAAVIFVAGVSIALSDLYVKVGALSHEMMHLTSSSTCAAKAHGR